MSNFPLAIPPGIVRPGTVYGAQGRWYDGNLVRWLEGVMRPWDGFASISAGSVAASNILTSDAVVPTANDTVTIGSVTYTFKAAPTTVANEVKLTATAAGALANLAAAINLTGTPGTDYGSDTVIHPTVTASAVTATTLTGTAKTAGSAGNAIVSTEASTHLSWPSGTFAGGSDAGVGVPRHLMAWRNNAGTAGILLGTQDKIYNWSATLLTDLTPGGLAAGRTHALVASGIVTYDATTWSFDIFGQTPLACRVADAGGTLFSSTSGATFAAITNAPTSCGALVVTPEKFLVALAASADPKLVAWADQDQLEVWTPAVDNQAGDFTLPGDGKLMMGLRGRGETLLWTDADLWAMKYVGGDFVYTFIQLGSACGVVSRHGAEMVDSKAIWMGENSFFVYDGFVRKLPCEVSDYVFGRLSRGQRSKVHCHAITDFSEVIWWYPSGTSSTAECDSYVSYNYADNHWSLGFLNRSAGIDRGILPYPVIAHTGGTLYQHETGTSFTDATTTYTPYIESGPVQLGAGDNVFMVLGYIPDERTIGGVTLTLLSKMYPVSAETTNGPYTAANPTDFRVTAREVRLKFTQVTAAWRVGTPALKLEPGGLR